MSFKRNRGMFPSASLALIALSMVVASPAARALPHSVAVAYVTDFGIGWNDPNGPFPISCSGSSIFSQVIGDPAVVAPGGVYSTSGGNAVAFTNVTVATVDAIGVAAFAGFDTVMLYQVCDFGSHPALINALNSFLAAGLGKVVIFDGDRCGEAAGFPPVNYSAFLFPFTTSNPGPSGAPGDLTFVETEAAPNTLARLLSVGQPSSIPGDLPNDAVGDSNTFVSNTGGWCAVLQGRNGLGTIGIQEGYARTALGGLAIYNGQDFWCAFHRSVFQKQVFDDILDQPFNPDRLPCGVPVSGIRLDPPNATNPIGTSHTVTATVTNLNGTPVPNQTVIFAVVSGPNVGTTGAAVTNLSGQATFTYFDAGGAGTDTIQARFADQFGGVHLSNTVNKRWATATPPSCALTAVIDGPPKQLQITVQDDDDGLQSIVVTDATNCSVAVPPFAPGSTVPLVVTATKIDQTLPATVALRITDTGGNVTDCDPEVAAERPAPARGFGCSIGSGMGSAGMATLLLLLAAGAMLRRRRA